MAKLLTELTGFSPGTPRQECRLSISADGIFQTGPQEPVGRLAWAEDPNLEVIPGLVDIHVHGGNGLTFGEHPTRLADELAQYSAWVASTGVTGFVCSISAPEPGLLLELVRAFVKILPEELPGAACLGLHLEGPFLSEARRGAFRASWLHSPTPQEINDLLQAGQGWIRQVTIAPELPGASQAARLLSAAGVVAAIGHTDGDYDTIASALAADFSHITHTFNAMSTFHHFTPGAVGAVLTSARGTAELIADTVHVHPGAMRLLYRCLGPERVVLVTDAMAGAGMPDGVYELIGSQVFVKAGQARQADGRLAGSVTTLNRCVANMLATVSVPFEQAVGMASLNPARVIGLNNRIGSFAAGKDANFVIVDQNLNIHQAVVKGKRINFSGG